MCISNAADHPKALGLLIPFGFGVDCQTYHMMDGESTHPSTLKFCSMQVWHNFISIFTWSFFSYHLSLKVLILHTKVLSCSLMLQHLSFSSKISCNIENCTEYFGKERKSCPPINNQKLTHVPPNFW